MATFCILHPSLNKGNSIITYAQYLFYGNSIEFNFNNQIENDKVLIKWVCEDDNNNCKELIIYKNGKLLHQIPEEMGNQEIEVFYEDNYVGTLHQYKNLKEQAHKYYLELSKNNKYSFTFNGKIFGPSPSNSSQTTNLNHSTLASL